MTDTSTAPKRPQGERRQEIIDVAAEIFAEKGYEATSIQDIAEAVDILKGSLYYYIDSKEDLLFEVLQRVHEDGLARMEEQKSHDEPAIDRIARFVREHVRYNAVNLTKIAVFFHDFRSLSEERRKVIVDERDMYDRRLRELIESGQTEGSVCEDVNPKMAAFSILGMMNWVYQWYSPDGNQSPDGLADVFADLAVRSLTCPGDHSRDQAT